MEENNCNRGAQSRLPLVGPGDQNLIRKETLAAGRFAPRLQAHSSMRKCCSLRAESAISHPGARRRVKSLWERDFCVKCDEAHCGARVLGPLGTRVPDSRASP